MLLEAEVIAARSFRKEWRLFFLPSFRRRSTIRVNGIWQSSTRWSN